MRNGVVRTDEKWHRYERGEPMRNGTDESGEDKCERAVYYNEST
jgi:hypothetical protein